MATKKQQQAFNKEIIDYITTFGAKQVETQTGFIAHEMNTICGPLSVFLEQPERQSMFAVYCKFGNIELAKSFVDGVNGHSGKWNWIGVSGWELANDFKEATESIFLVDGLPKRIRQACQKGYTITVDNAKAMAYNMSIDHPQYFCYAISEQEAIGKMMQSDFEHKHRAIERITAN
jgi:hypothetical protein